MPLSPVMARKSPQVTPVPMVPPACATDLPRLPAVSIPSKTIEKIKLPPAADREKATRLARNLFKDEFAMTNSAAKTEFANRLYQQAGETDDDPASQFVLYRESAEIAATLDMDLALRACDAIAGRFEGINRGSIGTDTRGHRRQGNQAGGGERAGGLRHEANRKMRWQSTMSKRRGDSTKSPSSALGGQRTSRLPGSRSPLPATSNF